MLRLYSNHNHQLNPPLKRPLMTAPFLTIAFPTYQDFPGVWASVGSLFLYHSKVLQDSCEVLIVDNSRQPDKDSENWTSWDSTVPRRYLHLPEPDGTAPAKDACVRNANGTFVLVMDSHVMLVDGALQKLLNLLHNLAGFKDRPVLRDEAPHDFFTGPLLYDDFTSISTHFNDQWRGEMWGTWDRDARADDPDAAPFEIPANGNGLFVVERKTWLGFNPHFRGFGGEEWYIHEKYRRAGRKVWCLPFLRWYHRFGGPKTYTLTMNDKVRNYVISHLELGLPLDRIYNHFVKEAGLPESQWEPIINDPYNFRVVETRTLPEHQQPKQKQKKGGCRSCGKKAVSRNPHTVTAFKDGEERQLKLDGLYDLFSNSDLIASQLMSVVKEECTGKDEILLIGTGDEKNMCHLLLAAVAARPKRVRFYDTRQQILLDNIRKVRESVHIEPLTEAPTPQQIADADLTVVWQPYAKMRDVPANNVELLIAGFGPHPDPHLHDLLRNDPKWIVLSGGLHHVRLTDDQSQKKALPPLSEQVKNFAATIGTSLLSGHQKVSEPVLEERLRICDTCPSRAGDKCSECGCPLAKKAALVTSFCPAYKWLAETPGEDA